MTINIVGCDENRPKIIDCYNCGMILSYNENDVDETYEWRGNDMDDVVASFKITCPACQKKVNILRSR
jgi:hypothetical protein